MFTSFRGGVFFFYFNGVRHSNQLSVHSSSIPRPFGQASLYLSILDISTLMLSVRKQRNLYCIKGCYLHPRETKIQTDPLSIMWSTYITWAVISGQL